MIWIDFNVICIGQEQIYVPTDMNDIIIQGHTRTMNSEPFYNESYCFNTSDKLVGCWYEISLPDSLCYEESFFDIASKGSPYVESVQKWSKYVENILSFYITQSPINKIAILLRVQDTSNDIVHSDCSLNEFVQMLTNGNVKWNELYFVHP